MTVITWSPRVPAPRWVFLLTLLGAMLVQLAWVLALPAFRGIDEVDHVFEAESVAHGHLTGLGAAGHGTGQLVAVPPDVVAAAHARCESYKYTPPDNCNAVRSTDEGLVLVASAASGYNPVYYTVVGMVGLPFHGDAVVFAMRAVTAVITAGLLALAAVVTAIWARTAWPLMGLLVAASPVLTYSGAVASPNGVGYAAGCLLWVSLLGLTQSPKRLYLLGATGSTLLVLCTHSTGFIWWIVTLLITAQLRGWRSWIEHLRPLGREVRTAAIVVTLGFAGTLGWILANRTNDPRTVTAPSHLGSVPWSEMPAMIMLWFAQSIGAFPIRDQPAPLPVYALWTIPLALVIVMGARRADRRLRVAMLALAVGWVTIPVAASWLTYDTLGFAWQGRYALVLAVGLPLLAGLALDRAGVAAPRWLCVPAVVACAAACALSVGVVAHRETRHPLATDFSHGVPGGPWLLAATVLGGYLLAVWALTESVPSRLDSPRVEEMLVS